jgi:hypothetical protein
MNTNESWIAEQARLLTLEDGFGPGYSTKAGGPSSGTTGGDETEGAASRSGA